MRSILFIFTISLSSSSVFAAKTNEWSCSLLFGKAMIKLSSVFSSKSGPRALSILDLDQRVGDNRPLAVIERPISEIPTKDLAPVPANILLNKADLAEQALIIAPRFINYFKIFKRTLSERNFAIVPMELALLAKAHVIFVGPPGNAKTMLINGVIQNIKALFSSKSGATELRPDYFVTQLTKETTLGQTHGDVNYKVQLETGDRVRNVHEGMVGHFFAFLDEIFDVRPNALRNILQIAAEGLFTEAGKTYPSRLISIFAASNRPISEVYGDFEGSTAPDAVLDRAAYFVYVTEELFYAKSHDRLAQGRNPFAGVEFPLLTVQDVQVLEALVDQVSIPLHVARFVSRLHWDLGPVLRSKENAAELDSWEKKQNQQMSLPPWKASKKMSTRTEALAFQSLKAAVVLSWLESGGERPLSASIADVSELRKFYAINSAERPLIEKSYAREKSRHERAQILAVISEQEAFDETYRDLKDKYDASLATFNLDAIAEGINQFGQLPESDKQVILNDLKKFAFDLRGIKYGVYLDGGKIAGSKLTEEDNTPERIAKLQVYLSVNEWARKLYGEKYLAKVLAAWRQNQDPENVVLLSKSEN
jgi:hypothetical protein